jgi:hypothetical protein
MKNAFISFFFCIPILVGFMQTSDQFLHWFIIPVTLSGLLICIDAIKWFRGQLSIFDPVGIIGMLGVHFFFLAPFLHVSWNSWLEPWITPPPDWRPWVGGMAVLNLLGLLVYGFSRKLVPKFANSQSNRQSKQAIWKLDQQRFLPIIYAALVLSAGLQIMVYQQFGGILGYINSATNIGQEGSKAFEGLGIVFLFSESFPILAMMAYAFYARKHKMLRTWPILLIVLAFFLVLQLLFGGLRGSRSNTVWALFWAAGIIHFRIRPISRKEIAVGLVFLVFFMYLYGFFKAGGLEGVQTALKGQETRAELEKESGRTLEGLILGDLGRTDVQAYVLYRLMRSDNDYEYVWGGTYLAATSIMIPKFIWQDKPPYHKIRQGTEVIFGRGSYIPIDWATSKVFGIAGEAMLNFGPFAVPFAFVPLGILVGWVQRCLITWESSDIRLILLPMLVNLCFVVLVSDLDNDIFFVLKNSGLPAFVILMSVKKEYVTDSTELLPQPSSYRASLRK